jgi:hypothetical protein
MTNLQLKEIISMIGMSSMCQVEQTFQIAIQRLLDGCTMCPIPRPLKSARPLDGRSSKSSALRESKVKQALRESKVKQALRESKVKQALRESKVKWVPMVKILTLP